MRVPTREECYKILRENNFPQRKMRHVELVEKVALFLGTSCSSFARASKDKKAKGVSINLDLVSAGALLHDIDKGVPGAGEEHPNKGVEILKGLGYEDLARICKTHSINSFLDPETKPFSWEEKCVALADKMVKDEIITVDERYRMWNEEDLPFEQKEILRKTYPLVKELEREILGMVGVRAEEVKFYMF